MVWWSTQTPAKRFRVILACTIIIFTVALSMILFLSLDRYVIDDTTKHTYHAVQYHFESLFGNMFASKETTAPPHWYKMVRMHFDIYQITAADFFHPGGTVVFSYDSTKVGQMVNGTDLQSMQQVLQTKQLVHAVRGNDLSIWMPITNESTGNLQGIVRVTRDISYELASFQHILITCLLTIFLCGLLLYTALKRVYDHSTEQLAENAEEIQVMLGEIETTYDTSLQALSGALDSRDNETNGHSFRVTAYTIHLAREMGMAKEQLAELMRGALLHDVGKIGVPDAILLKQGPLNDEEWSRMRSHVEIGYQMLQHIPFLNHALEIVRYHHERWDGKGYPYGLKGEEIPLSARIFSVCDTYDAITSDRPYRKGRSYEEARTEIVAEMGTQFDPRVVETFLRIPQAEWVGIGKQATFLHEENRQFAQLVRFSHSDVTKAG